MMAMKMVKGHGDESSAESILQLSLASSSIKESKLTADFYCSVLSIPCHLST